MGWYDAPKFPGVVVGDDAFDLTYKWILELSSTYEANLGRKPTFEEFRVLFQIGLNSAGSLASVELTDREVASVSAKLKPRPKRQEPKAGDVFAVRVSEFGYVFGRVIVAHKEKADTVEIFSLSRRIPEFLPDVLTSSWLLPPLRVANAIRSGRWQIVQSNENFSLEKKHLALRFVNYVEDLGCFEYDVQGNILGEVPRSETCGWPSDAFLQAETVEEMIAAALNSRMK